MAAPRIRPCNWPLAYCGEAGGSSVPTDGCPSLAGLEPAMRDMIEDMAVEYLWNWTKQAFGTCPITVRPCRQDCASIEWTTYRGRGGVGGFYLPWTEGSPGPLNPALFNGEWFNLGCGGCTNDPCSCNYVPTVDLMGPVASIDEVLIDGQVLDPSAYRIDNYRYLVRTDGGDWPVCQDMTKDPETDDNTFQVTYNIGVDVPSGGQIAAGVLACQMAKAVCGDSSCQLPQRLKSITRQGVSMTVLDNYDMLYEKGTTGLWIVDSWVASVNAPLSKAGYRVASPDRRVNRRTTG